MARNNVEFTPLNGAFREAANPFTYQFFTTDDAAVALRGRLHPSWFIHAQSETIDGVRAVRWYNKQREFECMVRQGWLVQDAFGVWRQSHTGTVYH